MANFANNLIIRYSTLGIIQKNRMEQMSSIMGACGRILAQLCTQQTYLVQEGRGKCRYDISSCVRLLISVSESVIMEIGRDNSSLPRIRLFQIVIFDVHMPSIC